jgi:hypothetical protein
MKIKDFISAFFGKINSKTYSTLDTQSITEKDNEEIHEIKSKTKHEGCRKIEQKKCTCNSCGNIYYYSSDTEIEDISNIFMGKFYTQSQIEDFNQCPRCGSLVTQQKNVCFWIDNKGNCVDVEEFPYIIKPTVPDTFQNIHHDYGHCSP